MLAYSKRMEEMMNQIIITKGSGGYGGPLVIKPTDKKNKVMYITGGNEPAILKRIVELTGLIPVNGFKTKVPDEEIAVAIEIGRAHV